jgi:hypothetical protein
MIFDYRRRKEILEMLTEQEKAVYEKLYDITECNMNSAGKKLAFYKATLLATTGLEPNTADIERLSGLSKREFVQAAYAAILKRFPDETSIKNWQKKEHLTDFTFKRKVIWMLSASVERRWKGIRLCNNVYFNSDSKLLLLVMIVSNVVMGVLLQIYSKLPKQLKMLVKKMIKRS